MKRSFGSLVVATFPDFLPTYKSWNIYLQEKGASTLKQALIVQTQFLFTFDIIKKCVGASLLGRRKHFRLRHHPPTS